MALQWVLSAVLPWFRLVLGAFLALRLSTKGQQQAETTAENVNRLVLDEDLKPPEAQKP